MATQQTEIGCFPTEWRVPSFGDVFDIQQGKQVSKSNREGPNQKPFLRTANVFWGLLDLTELDYMHFSEADETRLALKFCDLLVCEGGAIGRTAVWREELEGCFFQNHLHRLRAKEDADVVPEFVLYWLWYGFEYAKVYGGHGNVTTIPNLSQSRLRQMLLPLPDATEQRQIARLLATVQRAIEQQQAIIATTRELKRSLMHKLFTEGLRGEAQKPTEIGLVPESWDVLPLGGLVARIDYGTSVKCDYDKTGLPVLRIPNVEQGSIKIEDMKFSDLDETKLASQILSNGDLLFVRTNGVQENAGRCAVFHGEIEQASFASYLIRVKTAPDDLNPDFLRYYCETKSGKRYLSGRASRTADGKFNINTGTIRTIMVPKPLPDEQNEIVAVLASVEEKLALLDARKSHYADLFKTLLHQLMTAQLRVHDLDLDALGVPALD